jgi:hypothetical protein
METPMDTAIAGPTGPSATAPTTPKGYGMVGPPGILFYLATIAAIVLAVDANSRASFSTFLLVAPVWLVLAAIWIVRFVVAVSTKRLRPSIGQLARWLAIPVAMGLVFAVTRTDALFDARLSLSRAGMDQVAAEVIAGGSTDRDWIGLYGVSSVEKTANGLRFVIDDSGLFRIGFAYAPEGQPAPGGDDPLWCCDEYESVGGGWWLWTESWD